tara:strand:+ start:175 stop:555 length:381 start_codon:yes stop_codon:yes gene_type:complete
VYSKVDTDEKIIPKIAKCNNCEAAHWVYDVCRSELRSGKDQTDVTITIDDIEISLPDKLSRILRKLECDISVWEHCLDIIEEDRWGEFVVLRRDVIDENESVKILYINAEDKFKIENKIINTTVLL